MSDFRNNDWTRAGSAGTEMPHSGGAEPGPAHPPHTLAPPLPSRRHSRSSSSRRHSSSSRRKLQRLRLVVALLLAVIVAGAVIGIIGLSQLQRFRGEAAALDVRVRQLDNELTAARERLAEMDNDLRILLANRIPGISEISFTRPLEINETYVRNITFVRTGVGDGRTVRFSAIIENSGNAPLLPDVTIVLFDEVGLQTGAVTVTKKHAGNDIVLAELQPGETRQYAGTIELQRRAPTKYFVVEAR